MTQPVVPSVPSAGYLPPAPPVAPALPAAPAAPAPAFGADRLARPVVTVNVAAPPAPAGPAYAPMQAPSAWGAPPAAPWAAAPAPAPQAVTSYGVAAAPAVNLGQGPIAQTGAAGLAQLGARVLPAGTAAAVGAAQAIAANTNGTMVKGVAKIVESAGEPLLRLSWALVGNTLEAIGSLLTLQFGKSFQAFGKVFSEGAISLGALGKKIAQPFTLTAATSGGARLGLGQAIGAGLSGGIKAFKTSAIWAIPASAINAFIDYKYRDQSDVKRLGTNFAADVVGYTATGMAGAAVGATIGSMTVPLVGTIVGAVVGIGLGFLHDKISRPMLSDTLYDMI